MKTTNKNTVSSLLFSLALLLASLTAQADIPAGYTVLETITYSYDEAGNRIAKGATVTGTPETPIEAQYDTGNRLTQLTLKGQGPNGTDLTCTLGYDPNGNLNSKTCGPDTTQYTWDARNRLTGIQSPSVTASFKYDALGRRIERTVNGDTLQYLYDGDQAIAELRNGAVSTHILTGLAIDETIARYTHADERTLLTDALGSVLLATKEDTTVATAYGYSSYGETQLLGTDEQNPIQYTSRENDGTGLYYYRARYYDPQLKRFISEDPIGIEGGLNIYAYVNGVPTIYTDEEGLAPKGGRSYGSGSAADRRYDRKHSIEPPSKLNPATNDPGNLDNLPEAVKAGLCSLGVVKACFPSDTFICLEWMCTPKCGDPFFIEGPSIVNQDTSCSCIKSGINPKANNGLPGL